MTEADLPLLFAEIGELCTSGGHQFYGVRNEPSRAESLDQADVMVRDRSLTLTAADAQAASLAQGSVVVIGGRSYPVRHPLSFSGDGAVVVAVLGTPT